MKFRIEVGNEDGSGESWWEDYEEDIDDAQKWAEETILFFNNTIRPHEKKRKLLQVVVLDESNDTLHSWEKKTSGMSTQFRGQFCDLMYCTKCGITGKRFGLSTHVKIDSKYRGKVYRNCYSSIKVQRINPV